MKLDASQIKLYYGANKTPQIIDVPVFKYFTISGHGDPNGDEFKLVIEALYCLSYAVKMSYRSATPPNGYYDYKVFPLEGEWTLFDPSLGKSDKANFAYKMMIQQPDFVDEKLFAYYLGLVKAKKNNPKLGLLKFEEICDGLCGQILHFGSYDDEPYTFTRLETFLTEMGYSRTSYDHKEIYLSDPRKTVNEKLRTLLRVKIKNV